MNNQPNDLITLDELCEALLIGRNTAYALLESKQIKAFRIGRTWKIPRVAVDEYILNQSGIKSTINQSSLC